MFVSELGDEIVRLHLAGVRSLAIAHRLNVAQSTVHYHLRKHRTKACGSESLPASRGRRPGPAGRTRDQVARMLTAGLSRAEIARSLGIRKSTVSYHAARLGAPVDDRFSRRYDWSEIRGYYEAGHSA